MTEPTIADLAARLDAIEGVDREAEVAERRQRAEDEARVAERRAELSADGARIAADYRKALEAAETHALSLSEALKAILDNAAHISRLAISLGIRPRPDLDHDALEKALSQALGASLATCARQQRRFGYFQWASDVTPPSFAALNNIIPNFEGAA
jgi:chromosome condensin MukBEF ATPase and DNA-binding subunit MukB